MHWVVAENIYREAGVDNLLQVLKQEGIPHSVHKIIPFIGGIEPDIDIDGPVMLMGPYSMLRVAQRKGWTPGVFDLSQVTYGEHIAHWGGHMLNADAIFCAFSDVGENVADDVFFMRPVFDSKVFAGKVFDLDEYAKWRHSVVVLGEDDGAGLRADTRVMVSSPKVISREYRLWVVDGRVVTASLYRQGGRSIHSPIVEDSIKSFGRERASEWMPNRAFVLDVAQLPDGSLKVVETNTINAAGLYAADVGSLVEAIMGMDFGGEIPDRAQLV